MNNSKQTPSSGREELSLLFLDVVGYSKLQQRGLEHYLDTFLPVLADRIEPFRARLVELNTWGDGIVIAARSAHTIAELAASVRDTFNTFLWTDNGLPTLRARIALHSGEVYFGHDPVRARDGITGTQVNLAARIEPVTHPGEVWATESFRRLLYTGEGGDHFVLDDLGERKLAKLYGSQHLYRLRRVKEPATPLPVPDDLDDEIEQLFTLKKQVKENERFRENACLQALVVHSASELKRQFSEITVALTLPADTYPFYLAAMQRGRNARVDALALMGSVERFWSNQIGQDILNSCRPDSRRIFVLEKAEDLTAYFPLLQSHARRYLTYVISKDDLYHIARNFTRDFSIIEVKGPRSMDRVLATYGIDDEGLRNVSFSTDPESTGAAEKAFASLLSASLRCEADSMDVDRMRRKVFSTDSLSPLTEAHTEMSEYIHIDQYHEHEEKHLFYPEMVSNMLLVMKTRTAGCASDGVQILELGAGTGLFTKRLASIPNSHITAVEIDPACYNLLRSTTRQLPNVHVIRADSRRFRRPGEYDCVATSFAEHHIRPEDKATYLDNVRKNLRAGGVFVVGDEFLRTFNEANEADWRDALQTYHRMIIEDAERRGEATLVELETAALRSGEARQGDFKTSCVRYETYLHDAGFAFKRSLIGPQTGAKERGGVYVYTCDCRV